MRAFALAISCAAICAMAALPAAAQTGTLSGKVERDSMGTALGEAEVQLPALSRTTKSNWMGQFRFTDLPAGRYAIVVRAIGFDPFVDSVTVAPDAIATKYIVLSETAVNLEAQQTTAERRLPAGLAEMESRRKAHLGGTFVTDSALRAHDERKLLYMLASIAGIHQVLGPATGRGGVFLSNGRARSGGGPVFSGGAGAPCYISIIVDGNRLFTGPASDGNPPPDFSGLWARDYAGIEYYPSGASAPAQYNGTGASCGLLLLWTRR